MRLTSLGLRLRRYLSRKEVVGVAKPRKYHRVQGHTNGGKRIKPHVRRMPKNCKKK